MIPGMRQHIAPTVLYSMMMVVIVPGAAATSYPEDEVIMVAPERMALVEEEAWNAFNWASFDQDKIVSFGNYQYSVYWAADRTLSLMRWNLANDVVQIVRFESYRLADGLRASQHGYRHQPRGRAYPYRFPATRFPTVLRRATSEKKGATASLPRHPSPEWSKNCGPPRVTVCHWSRTPDSRLR